MTSEDSRFMQTRFAGAVMRDEQFKPKRAPGMSRGAVLALLAHVGLLGALAIGVRWRTSEPDVIAAEVWSATPQQAAPAPITAPPPPPPPPPPVEKPFPPAPPPVAKVEPSPADIAIEREKKEEAARRERERREQAAEKQAAEKKAQEKRDQERREREEQAKRDKAEKEAQRKAEAEEAKLVKQRDDQLKRMQQSMAGATGAPSARGNALNDAAASAEYAGRIKARIKPNIVFTAEAVGNPTAEVQVRLDATGRIIGRTLTKSSGNKAWDESVLRAVDRTEVLPRMPDGSVPSSIEIAFRPDE